MSDIAVDQHKRTLSILKVGWLQATAERPGSALSPGLSKQDNNGARTCSRRVVTEVCCDRTAVSPGHHCAPTSNNKHADH